MKRILIAGLLAFTLSGCGTKLRGTYTPVGGGMHPIDKLEFVSGDKVELGAMGTTQRLSYKVEGKKVIFEGGGQSMVMQIDDKGCLDGGGLMGKFCKK